MISQPEMDFSDAASHHDELSETQNEVLELIAGGLTNGEIAGRLDISLDGAKWNVSEVLTKLGLARREDAAAYYKWRRSPARRLGRHARALIVGVIGLAAVAVVGTMALWPSSEASGETPGAYFIEYAVDYNRIWAVTSGAPPIDIGSYRQMDRQAVMRQWFSPPGLWRIEFDIDRDFTSPLSSTTVFDGEERSYYSLNTNQFVQQPATLQRQSDWDDQGVIPTTRYWGRVPGTDAGDYIALLAGAWTSPEFQSAGFPEQTIARSAGELDGTPVVIIVQSPISCVWPMADDGTALTPGVDGVPTERSDGDPYTQCVGERIMWLDESRMLILRTETWADSDFLAATIEVTVYETDVAFEAALFEFTPPPGAVDVTSSRDVELIEPASSPDSSQVTRPQAR